jgi:hypothetical protein
LLSAQVFSRRFTYPAGTVQNEKSVSQNLAAEMDSFEVSLIYHR